MATLTVSIYRQTTGKGKRSGPWRSRGGIYLCQVSDTISCGACCGLYNTEYASFETLHARLAARTDAFARVPRDPAAIQNFARDVGSREPSERPLPGFHHCPFVGLIGPKRTRVGCLLHPLAEGNHGVDLRGLSHYGGMACKICFCPAHRVLSSRFREVLRRTAPNWHAYGILITEARTLECLFRAAETKSGGALTMDIVTGTPSKPFRRPDSSCTFSSYVLLFFLLVFQAFSRPDQDLQGSRPCGQGESGLP